MPQMYLALWESSVSMYLTYQHPIIIQEQTGDNNVTIPHHTLVCSHSAGHSILTFLITHRALNTHAFSLRFMAQINKILYLST